jgi:hypothetical protein
MIELMMYTTSVELMMYTTSVELMMYTTSTGIGVARGRTEESGHIEQAFKINQACRSWLDTRQEISVHCNVNLGGELK